MARYNATSLALVILLVGCSSTTRELSEVVSFSGQAIFASGQPVSNSLVVLQPIEQGYEIEMETDSSGRFRGDGVPGKYVYYFTDSKVHKSLLPRDFPIEYRDPRREHVVTLEANQQMVCKVE